MSCKLCDKQVYYNTCWRHTDAGYGDTDYGGETKHGIHVRICPNCGEIKIPKNISEDLIKEFVYDKLASIIVNNSKFFDKENFEKNLIVHIQHILSLSGKEREIRFLKINDLLFENRDLKCNCGNVLVTANNVNEAVSKLKVAEKNFCQNCGRKILPLKIDTSNFSEEPLSWIIESTKTWDNSDR